MNTQSKYITFGQNSDKTYSVTVNGVGIGRTFNDTFTTKAAAERFAAIIANNHKTKTIIETPSKVGLVVV